MEEFEFHQYFEHELDGLRKEGEPENDQEQASVTGVDNSRNPHEAHLHTPTEPNSEMALAEEIPSAEPRHSMPDEMVAELLKEAEQQANELMRKAAMDASEIVNLAKEKAVDMGEEAKRKGYDAGFSEGKQIALEKVETEQRIVLEQQYAGLVEAIYTASLNLEVQKEDCIKRYLKTLAELAMTIAEKVINISLRSSGEVIERMILSTMETSSSRQWAKIRISAADEKLLKQSGIELAEVIRHVADRVKIVVIEDAPLGTCYVEFPDQIIDASIETQLQNIREVAEELQF